MLRLVRRLDVSRDGDGDADCWRRLEVSGLEKAVVNGRARDCDRSQDNSF